MKRIQLLPQVLADQIAAGEVIERPASVLKEILENSFDAEATQLLIDIEQGGIGSLSVRDDGVGIHHDDCEMAFTRHATSKVASFSDLQTIGSLGFRGEALASIASVARVSLASRHRDAERGYAIRIEGGKLIDGVKPIAHPIGTTMTVQDLFFNTPARRRFLRHEKTEMTHCRELVKRLALSRFDVGFHLRQHQRTLFQLRAAKSLDEQHARVEKLCGKAFIDKARHIDYAQDDIAITGWLGDADLARNQADLQYCYVNGRIVRNQIINHAIRQVYGDNVYPGKYPCYVLFLHVAPEQVDVNVHPTKHEVRFHQSRVVHDFVLRCLTRAMQSPVEVLETVTESEPAIVAPVAESTPVVSADKPVLFPERKPYQANQQQAYQALYQTKKTEHMVYDQPTVCRFKAVSGLIVSRFMILKDDKAHWLIDLAAIWQQWTLDRWLQDESIKIQPLLLPQQVALTEAQLDVIADKASQVLGLSFRNLGPDNILLSHVPVFLANSDVALWANSIAELLVNNQGTDVEMRKRCLSLVSNSVLLQMSDLERQQVLSSAEVLIERQVVELTETIFESIIRR